MPGLAPLFFRVGGLGAECDWSHVLSLGEQQRVAMLRLLTHAPALAFLDEATSAVDAGVEKALYEALQACCPCYVSIGACCAAGVLPVICINRCVLRYRRAAHATSQQVHAALTLCIGAEQAEVPASSGGRWEPSGRWLLRTVAGGGLLQSLCLLPCSDLPRAFVRPPLD